MLLLLTAGFLFGLLLGSFVPYLPLSIVIILLATAGLLTYFEQRGTLSRRHGLFVYGSIVAGLFYWSFDASLTAHEPFAHMVSKNPVALEGTICEAGSIYAGVPAKKIKDISQDLISGEIERIANNYIKYSNWFSTSNAI